MKTLPFPKEFLTSFLELTLKYNIFEFNSELFLQQIGTAMGIRPAPSYANLFMAKIDKLAQKLASMFGEGIHPIKMWKRFLDDIFLIWTGTLENLHKFIEDLNKIHPTIKFTMNHTKNENENNCNCPPCPSTPFLYTTASVKDNKVILDLYKKPTDRCQYLLTSSCHPAHVTDNIPFSLAYRIVRICTESGSREIRLSELKELLVSRNYRPSLVDTAIEKATKIPRNIAISKSPVVQKQSSRPVLAITYDPRLPCIPQILKKHWRTMVKVDPHLAEIFPLPPLTAY